MGNLKGEKLRIYLDSKVIAASKNSAIHIAAQAEDVSTKDAVSAWAENEVVGFSWDGQVDALVPFGKIGVGAASCSVSKTIQSTTYYADSANISIPAGGSIELYTEMPKRLAILNSGMTSVLASTNNVTYLKYTNSGTSAVTVHIAAGIVTDSVSYGLNDADSLKYDDLLVLMVNKTLLDVDFCLTAGTNNRTMSETLVYGQCYITDLSCTAQNRANGTYTVQITGTNQLHVGERPEP